jgi:RNA polymerase nonessential primary-like sigma factor
MYVNETGYELSLSAEQQQALTKLASNGDADTKMIDHSLHMIVDIARHYTNRGVTLSDLVREGNLGLIYALETLDMTSDCCFSTHATQCINQYMVLAVMNRNLPTDSLQAAHTLSFDNPAHERRMTR